MIEIEVAFLVSPHCLLVLRERKTPVTLLIVVVARTREMDASTCGIDIVQSSIHISATTVEFPLCILFIYFNSLSILWLHLLWCLFLLNFRYSKISMENKTRPRLQDEQNWNQ